MPDILIRREMPRNCFECPLFSDCDDCEGYECRCGLIGAIGYSIGAIGYSKSVSRDNRRKDCPLVELPEHGDLVDKKAVMEVIDDIWDGRPLAPIGAKVLATIDRLPVVVPADKEEKTE